MAVLPAFRTLRFRLTLVFVAIFGLIQGLLWVLVDVTRVSLLYDQFDRILVERAQAIAEAIEGGVVPLTDPGAREILAPILKPFEAPDVFFMVRSPEGKALLRSANMAGFALPLPKMPRDGAHAPQLNAVDEALNPSGGPLRVVTLYMEHTSRSSYYVQVGVSPGAVDRDVRSLRRLLSTFFVVSLVVAGTTSWYMAGRSLRPVGQVARRAKRLSASRLRERIPVPPTQDEVAEMVTVINEMLDRLQKDFENQQRFVADVSHELKTPLAVLLAEVDAIRRAGGVDGEIARFLDTVEEETRALLQIVESFLTLSRIRAGRRSPGITPVSIEEVVLTSIRKCAPESGVRQVRLIPRFEFVDAQAEPVVRGDFGLLCSAVENLLRNAIRYSTSGDSVDIQVSTINTDVEISVRDRGPGIPEGQLEEVFEMFAKAPPGRKPSGSAGLGLSIARSIAELHKGAIRASNHPEGGCEFRIRLPVVADDDLAGDART